MRPLRTRLEEARKRLGSPWEVLERDYLLSWLLAGMSQVDALRDSLVFKGGTALKKCYFGDYRFSEDLDFTGTPTMPTGSDMERAVAGACEVATRLLNEYAPVDIASERYVERDVHPTGQEAFIVRARFPWHRTFHTRVMIEATRGEVMLWAPQDRRLIHEYGEPLDARVPTYALEELVAEKLRAILQHQATLEARGWSRSRARDYYDLWRVFNAYRNALDLTDFPARLQTKCSARNVSFRTADDFFAEPMLSHVKNTWQEWLGPLVPDLPPFDVIMRELTPQIESILQGSR